MAQGDADTVEGVSIPIGDLVAAVDNFVTRAKALPGKARSVPPLSTQSCLWGRWHLRPANRKGVGVTFLPAHCPQSHDGAGVRIGNKDQLIGSDKCAFLIRNQRGAVKNYCLG